jgi:hypothetical protein
MDAEKKIKYPKSSNVDLDIMVSLTGCFSDSHSLLLLESVILSTGAVMSGCRFTSFFHRRASINDSSLSVGDDLPRDLPSFLFSSCIVQPRSPPSLLSSLV